MSNQIVRPVFGQFFAFKNPGSDTVTGWGVKVPANEVVCAGDEVIVIPNSGKYAGTPLRKTVSRVHCRFGDSVVWTCPVKSV